MDRITSFNDVSSWLEIHKVLWQLSEFRSLGRFHACIDAADTEIEARSYSKQDWFGDFKTLESTSFGLEVGGDVPRWWVFAQEPNVRDLWDDTKRTLPAAQILVRSAERLCREAALTYEHVIRELGELLRRHSREIECLLTYANHLSTKHELAPAILFSYAVWGSTKRSDRSLEKYPEKDETERFRLAGELALGIQRRAGSILFWECFDLLNESEGPISADRLLRIVQMRIRENIIAYFTELRDSLRHIDTLCQEFFQREHIYADDRFVKRLLKKISSQRSAVETDLWDIKEGLQMWSSPPDYRQAAEIRFANASLPSRTNAAVFCSSA